MNQDYPASSTEPVCSRPVDAMTYDYRALCVELVEAIEDDDFFRTTDPNNDALRFCKAVLSARTALAQPKPEGPTDEELEDLAEVMNVSGNPVPAMRRALELWGR